MTNAELQGLKNLVSTLIFHSLPSPRDIFLQKKSQDPDGACQHPPEEVNGNAVEVDPETKEVAENHTKHQSLGPIERADIEMKKLWRKFYTLRWAVTLCKI